MQEQSVQALEERLHEAWLGIAIATHKELHSLNVRKFQN